MYHQALKVSKTATSVLVCMKANSSLEGAFMSFCYPGEIIKAYKVIAIVVKTGIHNLVKVGSQKM